MAARVELPARRECEGRKGGPSKYYYTIERDEVEDRQSREVSVGCVRGAPTLPNGSFFFLSSGRGMQWYTAFMCQRMRIEWPNTGTVKSVGKTYMAAEKSQRHAIMR